MPWLPLWQVLLTTDSSSPETVSGFTEGGYLSCIASDLKFAAKKPKVRFRTIYLSTVRDVELQQEETSTGQGEGGNACRVLVSMFTFSRFRSVATWNIVVRQPRLWELMCVAFLIKNYVLLGSTLTPSASTGLRASIHRNGSVHYS